MFSKETKKLVEKAILKETEIAKQAGSFSDSYHAYAILKEEIEGAQNENKKMKRAFYDYWQGVKTNDVIMQEAMLQRIKDGAIKNVMGTLQVLAVIEKAKDEIY